MLFADTDNTLLSLRFSSLMSTLFNQLQLYLQLNLFSYYLEHFYSLN